MTTHELTDAQGPFLVAGPGTYRYPIEHENIAHLAGRLIVVLEGLGLPSGQLKAAKQLLNDRLYSWWEAAKANSIDAGIGSGLRPIRVDDGHAYRWMSDNDEAIHLTWSNDLTGTTVATMTADMVKAALGGDADMDAVHMIGTRADEAWSVLLATLAAAPPLFDDALELEGFAVGRPPTSQSVTYVAPEPVVRNVLVYKEDEAACMTLTVDHPQSGALSTGYGALCRTGETEPFRSVLADVTDADLSNYRCFRVTMDAHGNEHFVAYEEPPLGFDGVTVG